MVKGCRENKGIQVVVEVWCPSASTRKVLAREYGRHGLHVFVTWKVLGYQGPCSVLIRLFKYRTDGYSVVYSIWFLGCCSHRALTRLAIYLSTRRLFSISILSFLHVFITVHVRSLGLLQSIPPNSIRTCIDILHHSPDYQLLYRAHPCRPYEPS